VRLAVYVAGIKVERERKNAFNILVEKPDPKTPLG
jgi:hypothetical protein